MAGIRGGFEIVTNARTVADEQLMDKIDFMIFVVGLRKLVISMPRFWEGVTLSRLNSL